MEKENNKYFREKTLNHPYFKTQKHFINFVSKVAKEKNINHAIFELNNLKMLAWCISINSVFLRNMIEIPINQFTWEIKEFSEENKSLKYSDILLNVIDEIKLLNRRQITINKCIKLQENCPFYDENRIFEEIRSNMHYSNEFEHLLIDFDGKPGVYLLYDMNKTLIYVGKSYNIKNRIQSSLAERKAFYCKVLKVGNEADANILEPYLISLLNPPLNGDLKTLDRSSFRINHGFRFTKLTKIFK